MKRRLLVAIAVLVFLLFLGMNGYQLLCRNWSVACVEKDGSQEVLIAPREADVKEDAADAAKRGLACTSVHLVRQCPWD
jgi:hypothetical protein